jgi:NosR/NirI family nitrous oxide reductase transcriptional regulator
MSNQLPVLNQPNKRQGIWSKAEIPSLLVVIWFVVCWFIGNSRAGLELDEFFELAYASGERFERINDERFRVIDGDGKAVGYVATGTASGYGGPLRVATAVTLQGQIASLAIVEHRETRAFVARMRSSELLAELVRKKFSDAIAIDVDVDAVSGATFTSRAVTQSVGQAIHGVARDELELPVPPEEREIVFGFPEILLIGLFVFAVVQRRLLKGKQRKVARWITMIVGLVFLGFAFNSPFVLTHINMVLLGYWPDWRTHLFWYILIAGLFLFKARRDWNVYCYDFCPFGAAQDVLAQVGGAKPRKVKWPKLLLWSQRGLVILAVSLALIFRNPSFTSFEIFGTMFRLTGSNFQFVLMAIIILLSLFLYRPWCRYLCPLHKNTMEGLFDRSRKNVKKLWLNLRPQRAT